MTSELSAEEQHIVNLIEEGYDRRGIAEYIGKSEAVVRSLIRRMCETHDCRQKDLPETVRRAASEFSS